MSRTVLMVVRSDVAHDTRVRREAATLAAAGHRVHVVGKDVPPGWSPPAGVTVSSVGARSSLEHRRPARSRPLPPHLRLARWALLPRHNATAWRSFLGAAEVSARAWADADGAPDVVHAHDFPTLALGARLADEWGAALVYDAHEWWSGRQRAGRPTPLADLREVAAERRLGARAHVVLTVSEGILERFAAWGWTDVHLVRNTFGPDAEAPAVADGGPPRTVSDPDGSGQAPRGTVYAGRIGAGRDLAAAVRAASPQRPLTMVGPVDQAFLATLPADRPGVRLRPGVDPEDVDDILREHGLALVTLEDTCENHRVALPNKLFHAVRAGVPVIAADLPELRRVVLEHDLGELYRPGDAASLAASVEKAYRRYPALLESVARARAPLSWETDAARLLAAYDRLPPGRSAAPPA